MDKLLPAIEWIKKNKFWLGCGILAIAMIATWFVITGQIQGETDKYTSEVKSKISAAKAIMTVSAEEGAGAHPNSKTEEGMKAELGESVNAIVDAWQLRYDGQKNILKWPTDIIGSDEFVDAFSRFNPPETFPEKYKGGYGLERYLQLYRLTIPKQMDRLCKDVLRTRWNYDPENMAAGMPSSTGGGFGDDDDDDDDDPFGGGGAPPGMGGRGPGGFGPGGIPGMTGAPGMGGFSGGSTGGTGVPDDLAPIDLNKYAVIWDNENQAIWHRKLTEFKGKFDHTMPVDDPTPLQVYMLQQDLWLLEAMFTVIRQVNGEAIANDLASIKRIDHVAFGREARGQLGALTPYDPTLAESELQAADSGPPTDPFSGDDPFDRDDDEGDDDEDGSGISAFDALSFSPYHGRYVNVNFEPLEADTVRAVLTGEELPSENLELIVAKRVPFRIALRMDERKIPELMTALANSAFGFEVRQIRLNRHIPGEGIEFNGGGYGESNAAGAASAGSAGGRPSMGMLGLGAPSDTGGDPNLVIETEPVETRTNYDVDVELYGIVKIYNPVRENFLRKAAGLEEANAADSANVTNPAVNPASKP